MTTTVFQARLANVREAMIQAHIDALIISNPENRQYVTGFRGHDGGQDTAGRVLVTRDHCALFTDSRYTEQATEETHDIEIIDKRIDLSKLVLDRFAAWEWTGGIVGIEAQHMTVSMYNELAEAAADHFTLKATSNIVEPLRLIKDDDEIEMTRKATEITCKTFDHLLKYLQKTGLTEQDVAAEIVTTMLKLGADDVSFPPIVACGPNGARPHAMPGPHKLKANQPIVIDMGAKYHGYCADMTRTVFLDSAPANWTKRYNHVLEAQLTSEAAIKAGISGKDVDSSARETLEKFKLAEYFTHSLGHGTGLEIHEAPSLSQRASATEGLPVGAIVTIEPGIYISGQGGIRIEDAGVVRADHCEILTTSPKKIEKMIIKRKKVP